MSAPLRRDIPQAWDDGADDEPPFKPLSAKEAAAWRSDNPQLSPWRVIAVQAVVGLVVALLARLVAGEMVVFWSALYGAVVVVLPGALMARGMTSRLSSLSPGTGAVSFMLWEFLKIGVSVLLLMLAHRIVVPLSWPALLVGLVVCIKVYGVAFWWRRPKKNS
jgi:ATP synthase protein I